MADDVTGDILDATYVALCERGYADVTMQDIADHTDKSKATLHYHYDSKRDLMVAFLDYLYEEFTGRVGDPPGETAPERLDAFIERALSPPETDPERRQAFETALLELKAQAPYDEAIRERLVAFDQFLVTRVRDIVADGIESGAFRDVDPADTARFVATTLDGAHTKRVAVGQDIDCTHRMLRSYVQTHLVAGRSDAEVVPE
ncbi:TetR/AcrR family transcriptional regulator [Halorientalis litorea]|uniref:TetR/AcrR family transcriptional regulator n=1 Tax=Halorientalis litorea TaxID=2931977 RepID=UPI001FF397A1|nr:TetR/AcrR family transcriptional regulator [Halorientalis litorea]